MKLLVCILGVAGLMLAQATPPTVPPQSSKDTMKDQASPAGDSQLASKVRKALMDDSTLSSTAQNVKVSSHAGTITLKGKVNTPEDRDAVVAKAKEIAGSTNVKDELTVSSKK